MDEKIQMLLEKAKIYAGKTGQAAESAGRKATELAQSTRLNLQIFDLNTECEVLYKEIGKLVYDVHQGIEEDEEAMQDRLARLDGLHTRIAELREQIGMLKSSVHCPSCGKLCSRTDVFCPACGSALILPAESAEEEEPVQNDVPAQEE